MGTPFEDGCAAASNAVDAVFGKADFLYQPMAAPDVNGRAVPDPDRPALPIVAFLPSPYARAFSNQARRQGVKAERPGHASARPVLDVALAQFPYALARADRVQRISTGKTYHVAEIRPDGTGRAMIDLNEV